MPPSCEKTTTRLLIIKMSSLGDLFHALPSLRSLRQAMGETASIDWVVNDEYVPVVQCFNDLDSAIPFPRQRTAARWGGFMRALREERYDLVIDLQGLLKSALVARLARAERRIAPSFSREGASLCYREKAAGDASRRHAVEQCLDTVRYLNIAVSMNPPPLGFPPFDLDLPRPVLAVAPVSRWPAKNWPPEYFVQALNRLLERLKVGIILLGSNGDRPVCDLIAAGLKGPVLNMAGRTSLLECCAIIREADLLLSVDSGPVHIAAAQGTPVLGLYGPTDPRKTGPYGSGHRVIRAEGAEHSEHRTFRRCTPETLAVMSRIDPGDVAQNLLEMLGVD